MLGIVIFCKPKRRALDLKILLTQSEWVGEGVPPPPEFNLGNLFLIPKDESGLVLNHRPITVGKSDNRLVASVMAMVLTPLCQHSLHPSQKGFIPGRTGSDHITKLTDHFYDAIDPRC